MRRTRLDSRGRLQVPAAERKRLGLKPGAELEIAERGGVLVLKPVIPKPLKVRSRKSKWGRESFLDAGEAITTDTDFQRLCNRLDLEYKNPIPDRVLKHFKAWTQKG